MVLTETTVLMSRHSLELDLNLTLDALSLFTQNPAHGTEMPWYLLPMSGYWTRPLEEEEV